MTTLKPENPKQFEELKGTRGCIVKHFAFCYDNSCQVHKEAKYGTSYWPQEPNPNKFKGIEEEEQDYFDELDQDLMSTCSQKLAQIVMKGQNPYLNTDYNSLYNYNPEEETFNNIEDTWIRYFAEKARRAVKSNIRTKSVPKIEIIKPEIPETNLFVN